jgi:hypothetical protein
MTEPAQPQPATPQPAQPAPAQPGPAPAQTPADEAVHHGTPVTIEPADESGTANETPGPASSAEPASSPADEDQPPGNPAAVGFPGEEPLEASPAEAQAAGHDTQPAAEGPAEPGPGASGASPVVAGAPADVVDLEGQHLGTQLRTGGATSNESPTLPQNVQSGAAKAHAGLGQLIDVAQDGEVDAGRRLDQVVSIAEQLRAELDRYIPENVRHAAMVEAGRLVRSVL